MKKRAIYSGLVALSIAGTGCVSMPNNERSYEEIDISNEWIIETQDTIFRMNRNLDYEDAVITPKGEIPPNDVLPLAATSHPRQNAEIRGEKLIIKSPERTELVVMTRAQPGDFKRITANVSDLESRTIQSQNETRETFYFTAIDQRTGKYNLVFIEGLEPHEIEPDSRGNIELRPTTKYNIYTGNSDIVIISN